MDAFSSQDGAGRGPTDGRRIVHLITSLPPGTVPLQDNHASKEDLAKRWDEQLKEYVQGIRDEMPDFEHPHMHHASKVFPDEFREKCQ